MKITTIAVMLFLSHSLKAQDVDYNIYHAYINKAETQYFLNNNIDSCLYYYDIAFESFDYNFVSDLVYASQIAYFEKKPFKKYIYKGFEYGLKIDHLKKIVLFSEVYTALKKDTVVQNKYKEARARYLKTINFYYLYKMYDYALKDQVDKYSIASTDDKYLAIIKSYTEKYGYPGTKVLGISDSNIFSEIGKPHLDLVNLRKKYEKIHGFKVKNYKIENEDFNSLFALIILYHIQFAYRNLEELFKIAVKKGEMHPRVVGLLYDNMFGTFTRKNFNSKDGVFLLNGACNYNYFIYTNEQVNALRKKWNIASLELDNKKIELEKKKGFNFFMIFWDDI